MSAGAPAPSQEIDPLADAILAARLLAFAPDMLGGISLRGGGPARELVLEQLRELAGDAPWRRLPANADQEGLQGGVDVAASLAEGRAVQRRGLLAEVEGGFLTVPMAERLREVVAGQLAQAMDERSLALVMLDDGLEVDERAAAGLEDRVAFLCDLSRAATLGVQVPERGKSLRVSSVGELSDEQLSSLAAVSAALGVDSVRPLLFALVCARANAALNGRKKIEREDLAVAVRLVLAPRATQIPQSESEDREDEAPPSPDQADDPAEGDSQSQGELPPEEMLIEAALAAIPPDVLAQIAEGRTRRGSSGAGGGKRSQSNLRGKPLSARPGVPRGGARLALIDSLRAAAPWQPLRRRERGSSASTALYVDKDDLRIRRFEERAGTVTIFCVDASGSAAVARLAEAKGAVERILAQAYVKRSEVALLAFRGKGAELLLPPTRSLTRARRALSELPGGGGTPLASGLHMGLQIAESVATRGRTPFMVILTDGSANIAADGSPGRSQAKEDALAAARAFRMRGLDGIVIDISLRPRPDAAEIAKAMDARYLPLPMADAAALERAVSAAQPEPQLVR